MRNKNLMSVSSLSFVATSAVSPHLSISIFFKLRSLNSSLNDFLYIYKSVLIGGVHNMFYILEDITIGGGAEVFIDVM